MDITAFFVVVLVLGLLLLFTPRWQFGRALIGAVTLGLIALGATPAAKLLLLPLENRFPAGFVPGARLAGVIVLGGIGEARGQMALYASSARPIAGFRLAMAGAATRLVMSGGAIAAGAVTEAEAGRQLFLALGFPPERLTLESRSTNTAENAAFTAAIVHPKPGECWALVTSAAHMPRAIGAFRAAGLDLAAYPVDYHTTGEDADRAWLSTGVGTGLALAELALHEWLGLLWYRLTGRSPDLFPAPLDSAGACRA